MAAAATGEEAKKTEKEDSGAAISKAYYAERRRLDKESWDAYWRLRNEEVKGRLFPTLNHYFRKAFDVPVTWFAETFILPLHDRYKLPYYHRRLSRVTEIDECRVTDSACIQEANFQYRLDRNVDTQILSMLEHRAMDCMVHYSTYMSEFAGQSIAACIPLLEEWEEAELNFFIKYGELGSRGDVRTALAKQKHRLIWERRHPEVMAERAAAYKEHKRKVAMGKADHSFWRHGGSLPWDNKEENPAHPYAMYNEEHIFQPANMSKDWQYYRDLHKDGSVPNTTEKERDVWPTRTF